MKRRIPVWHKDQKLMRLSDLDAPKTDIKPMLIIAIDPGPEQSAWVEYNGKAGGFGIEDNDSLLHRLRRDYDGYVQARAVIEQIKSYGMSVGEDVFETCVWTGRFMEAFGSGRTFRLPRIEVKKHICLNAQAKDSNIRQALIDRYGGKEKAIGKKSNPGPLYGVSADVWQALALAITWWETHQGERAA